MRQRRRLGQELSYATERFFELGVDPREGQIFGAGAGDEDQIESRRNTARSSAERFAAQSFDAIAHDRIARLAGHDQTEARGHGQERIHRLETARKHEHEVTDRHPSSVLEDAVELGLAANAPLASEPEPAARGHFL